MAEQTRDRRGSYASCKKETTPHKSVTSCDVIVEHSYVTTAFMEVESLTQSRTVNYSWKEGRQVVEFAVLLEGLFEFCCQHKFGTAIIDSLGGPNKVNNMLAVLNIPSISNNKLMKMERRAGTMVEKVALESMKSAAKEAYQREMEKMILPSSTKDIIWADDKESPQSSQKKVNEKRTLTFVVHGHKQSKAKKSLVKKFPCKTHSGISCAVDTVLQQRLL